MSEKCPWCNAGQYARSAPTYDQTTWVTCGYCNGTGLYEVWTQHPEFERQLKALKLA